MSRPLQAIVFDFDGVIANSEPLHLLAFQQALADSLKLAQQGGKEATKDKKKKK